MELQPEEAEGQILIAVIDETYGVEDNLWEAERETYRLGLKEEFSAEFQDANIGPGADLPAFVTMLSTLSVPAWAAVLGTFFLGKSVDENLAAWCEIGKRIRRFFTRPVALNRHGAAVMAVEAIFEEMQGVPTVLRLISYHTGRMADTTNIEAIERFDEITDALPTLYIGFIEHIFEIEADGVGFRVVVDRHRANVLRLDT